MDRDPLLKTFEEAKSSSESDKSDLYRLTNEILGKIFTLLSSSRIGPESETSFSTSSSLFKEIETLIEKVTNLVAAEDLSKNDVSGLVSMSKVTSQGHALEKIPGSYTDQTEAERTRTFLNSINRFILSKLQELDLSERGPNTKSESDSGLNSEEVGQRSMTSLSDLDPMTLKVESQVFRRVREVLTSFIGDKNAQDNLESYNENIPDSIGSRVKSPYTSDSETDIDRMRMCKDSGKKRVLAGQITKMNDCNKKSQKKEKFKKKTFEGIRDECNRKGKYDFKLCANKNIVDAESNDYSHSSDESEDIGNGSKKKKKVKKRKKSSKKDKSCPTSSKTAKEVEINAKQEFKESEHENVTSNKTSEYDTDTLHQSNGSFYSFFTPTFGRFTKPDIRETEIEVVTFTSEDKDGTPKRNNMISNENLIHTGRRSTKKEKFNQLREETKESFSSSVTDLINDFINADEEELKRYKLKEKNEIVMKDTKLNELIRDREKVKEKGVKCKGHYDKKELANIFEEGLKKSSSKAKCNHEIKDTKEKIEKDVKNVEFEKRRIAKTLPKNAQKEIRNAGRIGKKKTSKKENYSVTNIKHKSNKKLDEDKGEQEKRYEDKIRDDDLEEYFTYKNMKEKYHDKLEIDKGEENKGDRISNELSVTKQDGCVPKDICDILKDVCPYVDRKICMTILYCVFSFTVFISVYTFCFQLSSRHVKNEQYFRNKFGKIDIKPNHAKQIDQNEAHFGLNEAHVGQSEEHFGQKKKQFGKTEEHIGQKIERFGENEEHFGRNEEHFGQNEEHFGQNEEHFGQNEEHFGKNKEHLDPSEEHIGQKTERFGQNEEHLGQNEEHFGQNEEHFGQNEEHIGKNKEHFGQNEEHFGQNEEHFGQNEEHVVKNEEHFAKNKEHFDPNEENFGQNEENFGQNKEHAGQKLYTNLPNPFHSNCYVVDSDDVERCPLKNEYRKSSLYSQKGDYKSVPRKSSDKETAKARYVHKYRKQKMKIYNGNDEQREISKQTKKRKEIPRDVEIKELTEPATDIYLNYLADVKESSDAKAKNFKIEEDEDSCSVITSQSPGAMIECLHVKLKKWLKQFTCHSRDPEELRDEGKKPVSHEEESNKPTESFRTADVHGINDLNEKLIGKRKYIHKEYNSRDGRKYGTERKVLNKKRDVVFDECNKNIDDGSYHRNEQNTRRSGCQQDDEKKVLNENEKVKRHNGGGSPNEININHFLKNVDPDVEQEYIVPETKEIDQEDDQFRLNRRAETERSFNNLRKDHARFPYPHHSKGDNMNVKTLESKTGHLHQRTQIDMLLKNNAHAMRRELLLKMRDHKDFLSNEIPHRGNNDKTRQTAMPSIKNKPREDLSDYDTLNEDFVKSKKLKFLINSFFEDLKKLKKDADKETFNEIIQNLDVLINWYKYAPSVAQDSHFERMSQEEE